MRGAPHALALFVPVTRLLGQLRGHRRLFVESLLSMTAFQLATAVTVALSTGIAAAASTGSTSRGVWLAVAGLGVAVICVGSFTWIESWMSHLLAYRILHSLRMQVYAAVERIVPARSQRRRAGEVAGTAMNDVELLEWFYAHTVAAAVNAVVCPALISAALIVLVGPVGLIVPLGLAVFMAIPFFAAGLQQRQGAAVRQSLGRLQAVAFEGVEAKREIAALGLHEHHRAAVAEHTREVARARRRFAVRAAVEAALADAVLAALNLGFLAALMGRVSAGALDPRTVPVAMVLLTGALLPAVGVFGMFQRSGEMASAARRVQEIVDDNAHADNTEERPGVPVPAGPGVVEFRDVRFGYVPQHQVLCGFTAQFRPGEVTALVGASGAGKSTVGRLLTRFWEPDGGEILLDGFDLTGADILSLRAEVAMVTQHPYLFQGTLRSNLLISKPDATDAELMRAVRDAGLRDTVARLPDGLDAPIGERGAQLSGGQRQRLCLAQFLLKDPRVLVLDEVTANLDAVGEEGVSEVIADAAVGRTVIVIAHRVSTIRRCDRVVFLDDGVVRAEGTHDELVRTDPRYRELVQAGDGSDEIYETADERRCTQ